MPNVLQEYFATYTQKSAADVIALVNKLPEDKRGWRPMDKGRSALDQVAECALVNKAVVELIETGTWPITDLGAFETEKNAIMGDWSSLSALLTENTDKVASAIRAIPNDSFEVVVQLPWGPGTLGHVMAMPQWNLAYHEGQITYIQTLL